jgi:hypothetical protein
MAQNGRKPISLLTQADGCYIIFCGEMQGLAGDQPFKGGSIMRKLALFTAVAVLAGAVQVRAADTIKLRLTGTF